jgi:hypothetical protein
MPSNPASMLPSTVPAMKASAHAGTFHRYDRIVLDFTVTLARSPQR